MPSYLKFLSGVVVPKVCIIAAAAMNARIEVGLPGDCLITSANDKVHARGSRHYTDEALDLRTRDLKADQIQSWAKIIKRRLGKGFDVVIESDHIHVEWDPQ